MSDDRPANPQLLSNLWYDRLKFLAVILLPAAGAAYFGIAQIWGLPNAEEVSGTILVIDTFLGALLGLSSRQYNAMADEEPDGYMVATGVNPDNGLKDYQMVLVNPDPEALFKKDEIKLKVDRSVHE